MKTAEFNTIVKAMLNYYFCMYKDSMSQSELLHLLENIDYNSIEDRYLTDDSRLFPYVKWERLNKMQAIRAVSRSPEILNYIDLKKFDYKIKEIFFFIQRDFNRLFTYFNFDFNNLSQDDAYFLLCLGQDEFWNKLDIKKYRFNFLETINIIRAYNYRRDIILNLDYVELKNYQITEILIMTGEEFLDLFDLECLSTLNWLDLLMYQPNFLSKCDFDKFVKGDPFNLVQLIVMFERPDLSYLLERIDIKTITPFGWEKLLIANPEKFSPICDFGKLNEGNWLNILAYSPELIVHKNNQHLQSGPHPQSDSHSH